MLARLRQRQPQAIEQPRVLFGENFLQIVLGGQKSRQIVENHAAVGQLRGGTAVNHHRLVAMALRELEFGQTQPGILGIGFALEHLQVDALSLLLLPDAGEYPGDIDPHRRGGIRARQHTLEHRGDPRGLAGFEVEIGEVPVERPVVRLVLQQHLNLLDGAVVVALALQKLD